MGTAQVSISKDSSKAFVFLTKFIIRQSGIYRPYSFQSLGEKKAD